MNSSNQNENSVGEENATSIKHTPATEFITVPSFLLKTYEIVDDPNYDSIVKWNEPGDAFVIVKTNEFCQQLLPMYFKHQNLSSFIRQLNMYGFHKTKGKNNEQCFAHEHFKRDDKHLLLKMKRRTKANEKKANDPYIRSSEVLKMFKEMNDRINEQEKRIKGLEQMNKEFKNSVLALYTELEKSKQREKMISERQMSQLFNNQNEGPDDLTQDKTTYRCSKEEMMNLFKAFVEKFIQNFNPNQMNNMFCFDGANNYNYYSMPRKRNKSNAHEFFPIDGNNYNQNMLENGPMSSKDSIGDLKDQINSLRKRDTKAIKPNSLFDDHQTWKKVSELKSNPSSPKSITRKDLAIGYNRDEYENSGLFLSRNNSVISDYEHNKPLDNISLSSHQKFDEFLADDKITKPMPTFADHNNFEIRSHRSKSDADTVKSLNNFGTPNKVSGKKRKQITQK